MNLFLDIETIPSQSPQLLEDLRAAVKAPGQYSKPESIQKWLEDNREAVAQADLLKTSFDGAYGQIVAISWATDLEGETEFVQDLDLESEKGLLNSIWDRLVEVVKKNKPVIVGHNVAAFDIPFLWKRSIVHQTRPPIWFPRNPKPWSDSVFDTMHQWDGEKRISMDNLCKALGIPGKGEVTGADVWPMAQAGKFEEIARYCQDDVNRTREIYKRMTFL